MKTIAIEEHFKIPAIIEANSGASIAARRFNPMSNEPAGTSPSSPVE
jgi:hypothetical protein